MQHVTAFSRPQTVPAVPAAAPRRNFWILNSWRDLILYVGTPLLLVPLFALAQARFSAQDIYVFVAIPKAPIHNSLGVIYMRLGQVSQAIAQFNEVLRLQPDDAVAAENLRTALANDRRVRGESSTPR
ncbi:MAG TPA: hypothetical protein DIT76_01295 [Spartobacteria bacterium]|jgi:tetratricopeptide (TPR) repeat protein|nr:hypothetical protein [Spartobacteria bacterium]